MTILRDLIGRITNTFLSFLRSWGRVGQALAIFLIALAIAVFVKVIL